MKSITFSAVVFSGASIFLVLSTACGGPPQDASAVKSSATTKNSVSSVIDPAPSENTPMPKAMPSASNATSPPISDATKNAPSVRPSAEEWANGQPGSIDGAAELGCQVTVVREWVRIACAPKTPKGARIIDINVFLECENGSCTSHLERASLRQGQRILEEPLLEGYEIRANFSWENSVELLRLQWPKGSAKPTKLGEFTPDPDMDKTVLGPQLRAMNCCIEVQGEKTCLGRAAGYADGPCFRSFQKDCKKLVACQMGELPPPCASSPQGCDN